MVGQDLSDQSEAEASTVFLGRIEGPKDAAQRLVAQTRSAVLDLEPSVLASWAISDHTVANHDSPLASDRLRGVLENVDQDLLQLILVDLQVASSMRS